jgi:hypothetical protein
LGRIKDLVHVQEWCGEVKRRVLLDIQLIRHERAIGGVPSGAAPVRSDDGQLRAS